MQRSLYSDVFAESWYAVTPAAGLAPGDVRPLDALGLELVIFRTHAGELGAVERHCPHMGASLAKGAVAGEHLVCPFHRWEYDRGGHCRKIPYRDHIPSLARLAAFPVQERNGWIWLYNGREPAYELPPWPDCGKASTRVARRSYELDCHALLVLENAADTRHGVAVHGVPEGETRAEVLDVQRHEFSFAVTYTTRLPRLGLLANRVRTRYVGASTLYGLWSVNGRDLGHFLVSAVPVTSRRTIVNMAVAAEKLRGPLAALGPLPRWLVTRMLFRGVPEDYEIWRHMNPERRRVLVGDDALQQQFRRYYRRHQREPVRHRHVA